MHVLIIDDEAALRQILLNTVTRAGYTADTATGVRDAAAKLVRGDVDIALCDIRMPDGDGVELVRSMRAAGIDTQFVMVTAYGSMETAIEALRAGATDYMVKPINNEDLLHRLGNIDALRGLKAENRALRRFVGGEKGVFRFDAPKMIEVERLVARVAITDSTVLVTGESGTGKGVIVRSIHEQSPRSEAPFIPINCSAIPEHLLESELFGHTKGAFSGADRARKGLFAQADHGTLFLDEIGEMPLHMQAKILHVIEDKEVRPVGGEQARHIDTRIITATNRDLLEMVKQGTFREDLYFRLSKFDIAIPPLRERKEDIPRLIRYVMQNIAGVGKTPLGIDPIAEEILTEYQWPGNVRELENVINRAYILADGGRITLSDLPPDIARHGPAQDNGSSVRIPGGSLRDQMRNMEADVVFRAMEICGGDRRLAAQQLEIGLSSLYRKLEEFNAMGITQARN
ncbi:MAG: sigma-54 dependent transcriptional regulator [Sterolibacterium sp.]